MSSHLFSIRMDDGNAQLKDKSDNVTAAVRNQCTCHCNHRVVQLCCMFPLLHIGSKLATLFFFVCGLYFNELYK